MVGKRDLRGKELTFLRSWKLYWWIPGSRSEIGSWVIEVNIDSLRSGINLGVIYITILTSLIVKQSCAGHGHACRFSEISEIFGHMNRHHFRLQDLLWHRLHDLLCQHLGCMVCLVKYGKANIARRNIAKWPIVDNIAQICISYTCSLFLP